ncbi:hypothetical protein DPMN_063495 [Dreissena polymorpha]|uniref:Uncharacterized protein n=1 Tax=Dreissena polymorpha TaxID=45954 RepID=A0A9D4CB30_DREPO|nr:hypothetical protein DPMN_063495 [Dreissena polymorpha]
MEAIKNHEQNQKPFLNKSQETQKGKLAVKKSKQIVATTAPCPVAGSSCVDRAVDYSSNSSDSDESSDEKCLSQILTKGTVRLYFSDIC